MAPSFLYFILRSAGTPYRCIPPDEELDYIIISIYPA